MAGVWYFTSTLLCRSLITRWTELGKVLTSFSESNPGKWHSEHCRLWLRMQPVIACYLGILNSRNGRQSCFWPVAALTLFRMPGLHVSLLAIARLCGAASETIP